MTKEKFYERANSSFLMWLFLWIKLPGAAFMGVRLKSIGPQEAVTVLRYRWRSQNPFKSTYFAAQMAAAELSTGMLVMAALQGQPPISMLVVENNAAFFKKADKTIHFVCKQGEEIRDLVQKAVDTGEGQTIELKSDGFLPDGMLAGSFTFVWSIKAKKRK